MKGNWQDFSIPNKDMFGKTVILPYAEGANEHQVLYLSIPKNQKNMPLMLFFHGGGMTADVRECPNALYEGKYAVAEAKYRLATEAMAPAQAEDAAMAIAWCFEHAEEYGIDKDRIFVGGMSAGAYLAAIAVMNPRFLAPYGLSFKQIAGLILVSGQMTTHFRFKADMGDERGPYEPDFGDYAPMSHLSKDLPPMLLLSGEPGLDIPARPEENAFVAATLKAIGHPFVRYYMLQGHGHVMVLDGCNELVKQFISDVLAKNVE